MPPPTCEADLQVLRSVRAQIEESEVKLRAAMSVFRNAGWVEHAVELRRMLDAQMVWTQQDGWLDILAAQVRAEAAARAS